MATGPWERSSHPWLLRSRAPTHPPWEGRGLLNPSRGHERGDFCPLMSTSVTPAAPSPNTFVEFEFAA